MPAERLSMRKVREVLHLKHALGCEPACKFDGGQNCTQVHNPNRIARTRALMEVHVPGATVIGHHGRIAGQSIAGRAPLSSATGNNR